ncbi:hypothetical protein [Rosistilla oblonga]|uniref:hypothetical protein n=1 Tax=Rosistilla oblonga TaxID=2527990 RepID=UPI003A980D46
MVVHPAIQPTLCVIGFPVAGNAMQFALERVLVEAGLDWKFVSFNVSPDSFDEAVRGVKALGLAGLAIASPFETQLSAHVERFTTGCDGDGWIDFLQPVQGVWVGSNQLARAVMQLARQAVPEPSQIYILGDGPQARGIAAYFSAHSLSCQYSTAGRQEPAVAVAEGAGAIGESMSDADPLSMENIDPRVIVIRADAEDGKPCSLDSAEIEGCQTAGCCVELALDPATQLPIAEHVVAVSAVDVLVQRFANGFQDWTGLSAEKSTLREAVEEYYEL